MTTKTLLSIGECMAELQLAKEGLYSLAFGGDTLNTAWYVRALTHPRDVAVEYYTAVGDDPLSKQMMEFLRDHHVGTQFVREIAERNVGLYLISLEGAERSFTYWRSASAARLLAEDENKLVAALSKADVIYFSGITLAILEPEHRQVLLKVLQDMKAGGATVTFDSNSRRRLWPSDQAMKEATLAGYGVATLALPTFGDEQALFGDETPAKCAERIAGFGVAEVIVKDGGKPTHLLVDGKLAKVVPEQVEDILDTTGAGDSFNAGYLAARMAKVNSVDAVKLAHTVAGRVIRGRGALLDMKGFSDLRVAWQEVT
jgi:2-dehydro-3-deoxygluconokinase